MRTKFHLSSTIVVLLIAFFPYFLGWATQGNFIFSGLLFNPQDGFSYLAKMRQGWDGSWGFTLPYTASPGEPVPLFVFYLFLGHLAKVFHLPLPIMYNIARFLSSAFLLYMLGDFLDRIFGKQFQEARALFWLLALGGGMGWLVVLMTGFLTGDFWVAEAYPFLSIFATPHFSLGLALILLGDKVSTLPLRATNGLALSLLSVLLALIQPFGVVILGLWVGVRFLVSVLYRKEWQMGVRVLQILPGALILLWQFWIIASHPVLRLWNNQNVTEALPLWDLILSLSPVIFLALVGGWKALRKKDIPFVILLGWMIGAILLTYTPFNLQRRFMTGIYIPVAVLGAYGISEWLEHNTVLKKWLWRGLLITSILTPLLVIFSSTGAVLQKDSLIYINSDEFRAIKWMDLNLPEHSVVLASPRMGLILPAWTDLRVVYGHPFETVNASQSKALVERFFPGEMSPVERAEFFHQYDVVYLFWGSSEDLISQGKDLFEGDLVYQTGKVRVFRIAK